MIADSSFSSAFDDLADLFLGGGGSVSESAPTATSPIAIPAVEGPSRAAASAPHGELSKPLLVEGLVLGHLPMMASLWASQYPRLAAASDDAPVALIRLDAGMARVEVFHPPVAHSAQRSRLTAAANGHAEHDQSASGRPCPDLAGAISRAAQSASRMVIYSSFAADELLFARSATISAMAVLTGADDASAVGAYKAIKRLATADGKTARSAQLIRVAVMGSEEPRASAAFHRLADAANSFLSVPIQLAGHCRQIAGGVPSTLLFDGPSAMTTQAVLEALSRPVEHKAIEPETRQPMPRVAAPVVPHPSPACREQSASVQATARLTPDSATPHPERAVAMDAALDEQVASTVRSPLPESPVHGLTPADLTPLAIHCPFDRSPVLAVDDGGVPQVIVTAPAGGSAESLQKLLAVAAWLWSNRELLAMVCPRLRTDARPVLHLVTDRPCDVKRLVDSDIRLHVRVPAAAQETTLALN